MLNKFIASYQNISVIFIFFVILIMNQNIYGQNIIKNPGFEKMNEKDSFPANWGKHWICKGEYPLKRDPMFAHSGAVCIGISQTGPNAYETCTTLGSARCTVSGNRQYTLYFWAKGKGKISSMVYLYGAGKFLQAPPKSKLSSKWFVINSKDWKSYKVNIVIPPEGVRQDNKKLFAIDEFEVLFNVQKGPVFIDDVELYLKGTKPNKKASIMKSGEPPFITITKMVSPPLIDGKITKKEWSQASETTGFFELGAHRQAKRQTELLVGFDEKNLYIAFSSKQKALLLGQGPKKYDFEFGNDMEGFEIWIQPPGKGFLQFLGVPAGGTLDRSKDNLKNGWSKKVKFANKIEGSGEMMGGTLTLGHKLWTGEIAIPFASIGVAPPKDGEVWRMNFCRDFSVEAGQARSDSDWTTWSPMKNGFADVNQFGYVKFSRKAPVLKLQSFGELNNGNFDLQGNSNGKIKINACIVLDKHLGKKILDIDKQFSAAGKFQLKSAIKTSAAGITGMRMFMNVENAVDNSLLARAEIPFELFPTFWIKSQIFYSAQRLEVEIDASRSANLPKSGNIEVGIFKQGNDKAFVLKKQKLNLNKTKFTMNLSIKDILPGSYVLKGFIKNQKNRIIASTSEPIIVPETPAWLGNKIGISEEVPSPFTPVKVDGNKVGVILREYTLANSGLPAKVISLGKNILAAPAVLSAVVNGEEINWKFEPLEKVEQKAREVMWNISGDSKYLKLSGTLKIEFDGFGIWDIRITPKKTIVINELSLDFPINEESALFAKGDGSVVASIMQDKYTCAPGREDVVTLGNKVTEWGFWSYSRKGWVWDKFFNEIYIGSEQRGFSIGTETDQNVFAKKYAEFIPEKKSKLVKMRINLVSKNTTISKPLTYKYFYQTTPFKPEPKDPKVWHIGFDPSDVYSVHAPGYNSPKGKEYLRSLYVGMIYYALKPAGYPRWVHSSKDSRKCLKFFQNFGLKVVHNLWYSALATNLPEYKIFGEEWAAIPKYGWSTPNASLSSACLNSKYQDFFIWCTEKIVNKLGFDGVYTDATAVPCKNSHHGCGYVGRDGKRHSTLNLLATREFAKRMYTILKSNGRNRLNFSHSGESTSSGPFVDIRTHGEELCQEGKDHYKRLSPDYFRAKYAQNEYGVPYSFYAVFHYKWRAVGKQIPSSEILMMCLPHRVTFGTAYNLEMTPVWKIFDPWWTSSKFIPYWKKDCPSKTNDPVNILASTFLKEKEKKALVVVSNWSYKPVKAKVSFDWQKMGFGPVPIKIIDVSTGKLTPVSGEKVTLDIPARDYRVLLVK